ncbi:hypothetical protein NIES2107_12890 [Nostoc carneum NIES-2107]|nr:hypothetical protein NIES2107_12890 [Nostoc carneum NIES-2107]
MKLPIKENNLSKSKQNSNLKLVSGLTELNDLQLEIVVGGGLCCWGIGGTGSTGGGSTGGW